MLLLDTNILIEVLVGCRESETETVEAWLDSFPRLPIGDEVARETVQLR
jgi:predicted nucleic acid-binding protein